MIISSQSYINEEIVEEKIANEDFEVQISPEFDVDGETFVAILDGHHSMEAARRAGVAPEFVEQECQDNDDIYLLESGDIDGFLNASYVDSYWYNIETGRPVW
jgi:hypothetical protein